MKWFNLVLIILLFTLQLRLWLGEGSVSHYFSTVQKIQIQTEKNKLASIRNKTISAEVMSLQQGYEAIESYARSQLGLIKANETFFMFVKPKQ